jgi:hypothetical protein
MLYSPVLLLASFTFNPVLGFSIVMAAPAIDFPEGSVMVPPMPPPKVCAEVTAAGTTAKRNNARVSTDRGIMNPPILELTVALSASKQLPIIH